MHDARKPPRGMTFIVSKTPISLALQRARKSDFVWRVHCVSCVRTKVHMSGYLFGHTCMHVTYSNKILGNEAVTTLSMHARACRMDTSKKQDGALQCMEHAHVRGKRCFLTCEHKKRSEITGQRPCCGRACTHSGTATLSTPKNMKGLGVRETAVSVR